MGVAQLRRQRGPQRAGGHDQAVADAGTGVDGDEDEILFEAGILQAVIHDDEVDPFGGETRRAGGAVVGEYRRSAGGEQRRLVAETGGVTVGINHDRTDLAAAIAAGEEARPIPPAPGDPGKGKGGRRLAGAADDEVADADDRDRRAKGRPAGHPPSRRSAPQAPGGP